MSDIKSSSKIWPQNYNVSEDAEGFLIIWIPLGGQEDITLSETIDDDDVLMFAYRNDYSHALGIKLSELSKAKRGYLVVVVQENENEPRIAIEAILSDEHGYVTLINKALRGTQFSFVRVAHISNVAQPTEEHTLDVILRKRE